MIANSIINSYLDEVRVNQSVNVDEMISMIKNLYKKTNRTLDGLRIDTVGDDIRVMVNQHKLLPGIVKKTDEEISTSYFERRYLKGTGWYVMERGVDWVYGSDQRLKFKNPFFLLKRTEDWEVEFPDAFDMEGSKPRFLYHVSPTRLEKKILKEGLKPKSQPLRSSFSYIEPRVFLFTRLDRESIEDHYKMMLIGNKRYKDDKFTVFEIDTRKFNRFNLKKDLQVIGGDDVFAYTLTHIPSEALKIKYRFDRFKHS